MQSQYYGFTEGEKMQRILLKLSGEALAGEKKHGFDEDTVRAVALQVKQLVDDGIQVGIVIGGGNFWRGRTSEHIDRTKAAGLALVHPHKEHMFSNVGLVVLANTIAPEAKKLIKRTHFRKNYLLSLHGWTEYQLAAMETSTNCFFSNPAGKEVRKNLESNFAPREPKKGVNKKV